MRHSNLLPLLLALFLFAPSLPTSAAVIERDWKTSGDGLLTYDDVNQREWLDVPESLLSHYGNSYENVVAETLPGGDFEGFSVAKGDDVIALAESTGIDTGTLDFGINATAAEFLINLIGETAIFGAGGLSSAGLIDKFVSPSFVFPDQLALEIRLSPGGSEAGIITFPFSEISIDRPHQIVGVMLFRTVPEPSTSILLTSFLLLLLPRRTTKVRV